MRYQQLILQKVALDREIRAFRVVRIRKAFINHKSAALVHAEMDKMEATVSSVFYDEQGLDLQLEYLEVILDLDISDNS